MWVTLEEREAHLCADGFSDGFAGVMLSLELLLDAVSYSHLQGFTSLEH